MDMNIPWIEKYRPKELNEIIGHKKYIKIFKDFVKKNFLPNMIFYGESGIGKTSVIKALINEIYKENELSVLEINSTQERGIDVVRDKIYHFSTTISTNNKIVVIDEADSLTNDAQYIIKKIIEDYNISFCFICNHIKKIIPSIISRCIKFKFNILKSEEIFSKIQTISLIEKFKFDKNAIYLICSKYKDMRKILNIVQSLIITYGYIDEKNVVNCLSGINDEFIENLYQDLILKKPIKIIYNQLIDYIENGNSINEIINEIFKKTTNNNNINILIKLSKINGNLLLSPIKILVSNFISCFY